MRFLGKKYEPTRDEKVWGVKSIAGLSPTVFAETMKWALHSEGKYVGNLCRIDEHIRRFVGAESSVGEAHVDAARVILHANWLEFGYGAEKLYKGAEIPILVASPEPRFARRMYRNAGKVTYRYSPEALAQGVIHVVKKSAEYSPCECIGEEPEAWMVSRIWTDAGGELATNYREPFYDSENEAARAARSAIEDVGADAWIDAATQAGDMRNEIKVHYEVVNLDGRYRGRMYVVVERTPEMEMEP